MLNTDMSSKNYESTIYYHDTDAGGVVYYARYLNFLEEARTEFLAGRGVHVASWHQKGIIFVVRECHLIYKKPARYGDVIGCQTEVVKTTAAQIIMRQILFNRETSETLVEADVHLVCISATFKPIAIPPDIKVRLC